MRPCPNSLPLMAVGRSTTWEKQLRTYAANYGGCCDRYQALFWLPAGLGVTRLNGHAIF
jgi:hypothetical protein